MDALLEIGGRHALVVVEDCAQALGAALGGHRVGSIGHAGALSFYPTKTLGGAGDGGMIVTRDGEVAARLRSLRHHGAAITSSSDSTAASTSCRPRCSSSAWSGWRR
jgi:dTDP-4-amino-4,6-dideoxygalactose transaminase